MAVISVAALMIGFACTLRYLPQLMGNTLGVDHWFWKQYVRAYRTDRRFPPTLPQYVLDEHQWYPPVFPLGLSLCPWALSERASRVIPIVIDAVRMALLLGTVWWLTGGNRVALVQAGIVYATTPILISYNIQVNPRGLAALLLDALIVLALSQHVGGITHVSYIVTGLVLAGVILLTHKMTTQLLWFLALVAAALTRNWLLLAAIPLSVIAALLFSGGFYRHVLAAHADIVSFWQRNWRWLQADPLRESPLYGTASYITPSRFYQPGLRGVLRHCGYMFGFNPWAWLLPWLFMMGRHRLSPAEGFLATWYVAVMAFSMATVAVPALRGLGSGYLYLYNSAFPVSLLWASLWSRTPSDFALFAIAAAASVSSIIGFYLRLKRRNTEATDGALKQALEFLSEAPRGTVWCLPFLPSDLVAYHTGQRVLYGGHGYGFRLLERVFPRVVTPVRRICDDYDVRYVLTLEGYLPNGVRQELPIAETTAFGKYQIATLQSGHAASGRIVRSADPIPSTS